MGLSTNALKPAANSKRLSVPRQVKGLKSTLSCLTLFLYLPFPCHCCAQGLHNEVFIIEDVVFTQLDQAVVRLLRVLKGICGIRGAAAVEINLAIFHL